MDFNKVANQLESKPQQIKEACKALFGEVPASFTPEQSKQIQDYLKGKNSSQNKLAAAKTTSKVVSAPEEKISPQANFSDDELLKLIKAQRLEGERLGNTLLNAKYGAVADTLHQGDTDFYNALINGSIETSIKINFLNKQITGHNGSQLTDRIQIKAAIEENQQKILPPKEDLISEYLLPASEDSEDEWAGLL